MKLVIRIRPIVFGIILGSLVFMSCSKRDCECITVVTENGVTTNESSEIISYKDGYGGGTIDCSRGDESRSTTNGGVITNTEKKCETK